MWFEAKQPGRVRKHGPWIRPGEPVPVQKPEKNVGVTTAHVRVGSAVGRRVAEVTPTFDDLFWRAAADPELEPAVADQVGRARLLDHVERILVSHVDDGRADLDAARLGADGSEEREGRRELLREVMDAKVCSVCPKLLRRDSQFDRLFERV